jgi:glycosyltransferase 2 family protein
VQFLREVIGVIAQARPELVAAAVALHLAGLVVTGERWRVVVAALGGQLSLVRSTSINLAGIFVRNATPTTGLGGDASRIALLRAEGIALPEATASFVYVRVAELPAMAAVIVLGLPALTTVIARSSRGIAVAAAALVIAASLMWLLRSRLQAHVATWRARIERVRIGRRAFAMAAAYASVAQAETLVRQIVIAAAFGLPLTLGQSAAVTALSIAGGLVPTVGSVGAIEGSLVAGLMLCGASAETAIAITVAERTISYGLSTALGAAAFTTLGGRAILRLVSDRNPDVVAQG